jgi:hypothetical protein
LSTALPPQPLARDTRHPVLGRMLVGGFFLVIGGVHLGLFAAGHQVHGRGRHRGPIRYGRVVNHCQYAPADTGGRLA